jgi:hypothetical protein
MLNKSFKIIIISFFLVVFTNLRAQDAAELCSSAKINAYGNLQKAGKVAYPGDGSIDVTYYKLDLNITYSPQYLIGKVTVNAKPDSAALEQFFLDLFDNMTVDSVKLGSAKLTYTHNNNKLTITLDKT